MKRKSLAELRQEDELATSGLVPVGEPRERRISISEKINPKSEFVKMSITVEPEIFDAIEDLSRTRRKRKEAFTHSSIVREALRRYLATID